MINQSSVFLCNTIMTNFDKQNTFNLRIRNSEIQRIKLLHLKEHNSDIKREKLVDFRRIVCWMSGKHYLALVNTFCPILSHKI